MPEAAGRGRRIGGSTSSNKGLYLQDSPHSPSLACLLYHYLYLCNSVSWLSVVLADRLIRKGHCDTTDLLNSPALDYEFAAALRNKCRTFSPHPFF